MTHTFTKSNPQTWCYYFENLCIQYAILNDNEKLHAVISCLDHKTFNLFQPLISRNHSYEEIKIFLIKKFTPSLAERIHAITSADNLGDVKPSKFLNRLGSNM